MRVQGIKSLVAAVSSVLAIGMILSVGSQPGNMAAVPMAPAAQPAAARVFSTQMPELPSLSLDSRAATSDDLPGILFSTAAASLATSEPPEEAPGEDTTVLTRPSSVPTVTIPAVKKQTSGALLAMPIQGRKTSRFGMRFHPVRHIWKLHSGLDLAAPCGTPVGAAAPGTVVRTGWAGGNGIQVKIDHGTMGGHRVVTTYNHLSAIGVVVGQKVETHQGVGRVGTTGFSTGCHLHFEVIADGQFTNPEPWLNGSAVVVDTVGMGTGRPVVPGSTRPGTPSTTLPVSPTASATPSPSASTSPSPSPSPSASPSPSPSAIPSPSPSASPATSVTPTPTPSPTPTGSPQPCVSPSVKPTSAPAEPDPCASPIVSPSAPATPETTPTVEPSASAIPTPTAVTSPSDSPAAPSTPPSPTPPVQQPTNTPTAPVTNSVTRTVTAPPATTSVPATTEADSTPQE